MPTFPLDFIGPDDSVVWPQVLTAYQAHRSFPDATITVPFSLTGRDYSSPVEMLHVQQPKKIY